jgi:hypothetical protein
MAVEEWEPEVTAMKKLLLLAVFATVPAWAQDKPAATPAAPAAAPAATPAPAAPAAAAPAPEKAQHAKTARKPNPKRSEDARHCLDEKTNTDIIKCSEAYL